MAKSYLILFGCVFIWAGNYLARQFLLQEFSPYFLSAFSLTVISVFFMITAFFTKAFVRLNRKEFILFCLAGLIGLTANQIFLFTGLKYSTATNASLIFSTAPLMTAGLAAIILKEKITQQMIVGSVVAIIGLYVVLSVNGQFRFNVGDSLLLGATATFSCNLIFVRLLSKRLSSFIITAYSFVFAALIFDPMILSGTKIDWNHLWSIWLFAILSVWIGQGMTSLLWNKAMREVGAARSAIVLNLQPIMTMLLDLTIHHTPITLSKLIGTALVFAGILAGSIQRDLGRKKAKDKKVVEL